MVGRSGRSMSRRWRGAIGALALIWVGQMLAPDRAGAAEETATASDPVARAAALLAAKDWAGAVEAYSAIVAANPKNADAWFALGAAHHELGHWQPAADAYAQSGGAGYDPILIAARQSRVLSRLAKREEALVELEKAVKLGFAGLSTMEKNPDFESLRSDPRFVQAIAAVRAKADPCSVFPEYKQLSFWLGDWDVQAPAGNSSAASRITSVLGGCAIHEDYKHNNGDYFGQSLSAWSFATKAWTQRYVDSQGDVQDWFGAAVGNSVQFTRDAVGADGVSTRYRMTYTPLGPDRVRQYIEKSSDKGVTWESEWDGLYVRKP